MALYAVSSSFCPVHINPPFLSLIQLIIGDFGLSYDEQKAQMALWSIFAAVSWYMYMVRSIVSVVCLNIVHVGII